MYNKALIIMHVKFQKNSMKTKGVSVISKVVSFFGPPDRSVRKKFEIFKYPNLRLLKKHKSIKF